MHPEPQGQPDAVRLVQGCGKVSKGPLHRQRGMQGAQHMVFTGEWHPKQGDTTVRCDLGKEALYLVHGGHYQGKALVQEVVDRLGGQCLAQPWHARDANHQHCCIFALPHHRLLTRQHMGRQGRRVGSRRGTRAGPGGPGYSPRHGAATAPAELLAGAVAKPTVPAGPPEGLATGGIECRVARFTV